MHCIFHQVRTSGSQAVLKWTALPCSQMVVLKSINEDRTSNEVLRESGFLEKLKQPDSDSSLMIACMPEKDNPVGVATFGDEPTMFMNNCRVQASKRMIIEQLQGLRVTQNAIETSVIVTDLWPTLFVSLLMKE